MKNFTKKDLFVKNFTSPTHACEIIHKRDCEINHKPNDCEILRMSPDFSDFFLNVNIIFFFFFVILIAIGFHFDMILVSSYG